MTRTIGIRRPRVQTAVSALEAGAGRRRETLRLDAPQLPKALRDDVRLLGELLGETLRRQERRPSMPGGARSRAREGRARRQRGRLRDADRLLEQMAVEEALPVARAFSQFLNLANIAEQHHRVRRRRAYQRRPDAPPQIGSCDETFGRLSRAASRPTRSTRRSRRCSIELVFTAHPTEVTRRTLMQKHRRIAELLALRDHVDLTAPERDELVDALRREIAAAWETDEMRRERPSPRRRSAVGLAVFEQTLWDALPRTCGRSNAALVEAHRARRCRSMPRPCGSARGLAAIATATRPSPPR